MMTVECEKWVRSGSWWLAGGLVVRVVVVRAEDCGVVGRKQGLKSRDQILMGQTERDGSVKTSKEAGRGRVGLRA